MGIAYYVENQMHERTEQLLDDAQETLMNLCETAPEGTIRTSISKHGDTMLNVYQLRRLIDELAEIQDDQYKEVAAKLSEAAERAIRLRGYLYFVGD